MEKRIIGWLRQRRVAVVYGVLWCCSLGVIAVFFSKTLTAISYRADGEIAEACVSMYVTSIVLSVSCCFFWIVDSSGVAASLCHDAIAGIYYISSNIPDCF